MHTRLLSCLSVHSRHCDVSTITSLFSGRWSFPKDYEDGSEDRGNVTICIYAHNQIVIQHKRPKEPPGFSNSLVNSVSRKLSTASNHQWRWLIIIFASLEFASGNIMLILLLFRYVNKNHVFPDKQFFDDQEKRKQINTSPFNR